MNSGYCSLMVLGGQWGDEGKGKVVDLLSAGFTAVVRYNGGHNAGHTVRFADRRFALHLVPSGIIHEHVLCYLAAGMVIDPVALVRELDTLGAEGVSTSGRIFLSPRAALILPTHRFLDRAREGARGQGKIGTTGRGIGPAYGDLAQRRALRAYLLADPARLREQATAVMRQHNLELTEVLDAEPADLDEAVAELLEAAERVAPLLDEVGPLIRGHIERGEPVLFEGAQGVLLDLRYGTYPFVTSSSCLPAAAAASCGIPFGVLGPVVGIMKAYITRVGGGPFPSELEGPEGDRLRERGLEYGTTTGRPRRCGWFDAVAGRYAVRTAGIDAVGLMKLDVLDGFEQIRVAVAYELPDGSRLDTLPPDLDLLATVRPVLETVPGWETPTEGITDEAGLPPEAEIYFQFLESQLGVPIVVVSTGARREETLIRGETRLANHLRSIITTTV